LLPAFDLLHGAGDHTFAFKGLIAAMAAVAGMASIRPTPRSASFFPRRGFRVRLRQAVPRRSIDSDADDADMRESRARTRGRATDFGLRVVTLRRISEANTHVRVTNLVFPNAFVIPMSSEMTITQMACAGR